MPKIHLCDDGKVTEVAKLAKELGLGIEVQAFHSPKLLDLGIGNEPESEIFIHKKALDGIKDRSLHGAFGDLNCGSSDPKLRALTRERFEQSYAVAKALNISHIILHDGYIPGTRPLSRWLPQAVESWKDFIQDKSDTRFHIENMLEGLQVLDDVISGIGAENVDVCLDIGHINCNTKTSPVDWIKQLGPKIGYVHLHDNHGQTDEHLGLGKGNIPLPEVFAALKEYSPHAIWAIEAEGEGLMQSIEWMKSHGHWFNSP